MSKPFVVAFSGALLVFAVIVAYIFYSQRGNHLVPEGRLLQFRTVSLDSATSAAIFDFEITNPSGRSMTVRTIDVHLQKLDGQFIDPVPIAASDLPVLFRYHKELGRIENPPLRERDVIGAHQSRTACTAVRFDLPKAGLAARRQFQIVIEDVTGPKLEIIAR